LAFVVLVLGGAKAFVFTSSGTSLVGHSAVAKDYSADNDDDTNENRRRTLLSLGLVPAATFIGSDPASARQRLAFLMTSKNTTTAESVLKDPVNVETPSLSSEVCLLKLLPVKNPVFKTLDGYIQSLSVLRSGNVDDKTWRECNRRMQSALSLIDSKRARLEPLFIQDDSTEIQIAKAERGERLIEALRTEIVRLQETTKAKNVTATFPRQKDALLALADIGELLVPSFPFDVPNEGKFSFLPRLLGRCRVTFSFRRGNTPLGNVTIIADGFLAPITAGNFVDLSARQFYTGLPIKQVQKKLGGSPYFLPYQFRGIESLEDRILGNEAPEIKSDSATVSLPILGSFQEGFYDPLTAKPRRLPLEVIRSSKLSYARGFSDLSSEASLEPSKDSEPLLSFDIPGLVAMNHPDYNVNGASSEFFSLQLNTMPPEKRKLFDGNYAPFGYIIDGYDLYQNLKAGDVIASTVVGEWGQLNLVKKSPSFSNVMQGEE
jgi:peptidylprolyl isomerase